MSKQNKQSKRKLSELFGKPSARVELTVDDALANGIINQDQAAILEHINQQCESKQFSITGKIAMGVMLYKEKSTKNFLMHIGDEDSDEKWMRVLRKITGVDVETWFPTAGEKSSFTTPIYNGLPQGIKLKLPKNVLDLSEYEGQTVQVMFTAHTYVMEENAGFYLRAVGVVAEE